MSRFARGPDNILIVKTDRPSLVHRSGPMDCVIVKTYDADGRVTGERRLVGLFTSAAYHATVRDVPLLRGRVDSILRRSGLDVHSHDGKALLAILEAYPRDELFQIDEDTLYDHVLGILQLQERRRVALFARRDAVGRFATCLVFAPRERFDAALSDHFAAILEQAWQGKVQSVDVSVSSDSALAQVLYTLKLESNDTPTPDLAELERALAEAATSWSDRFRAALQETLGEAEGRAAARRWRDWFPAVYRDSFDANQAVADLELVQAALAGRPFGVRLDRAPDLPTHRFTLRLFHPKAPLALSDILPLAENLGLRVLSEAPFLLKSGDEAVALQVLSVETADKSPVDLAQAGPRFAEALDKVWARALESDGLNRLVLGAGLAWREVAILRTYAKYLRQAGIAFSQDYMERVLSSYPAIARLAIDLFLARFDPALGEAASDARKQKLDPLEAEITGALEGVATLDEDRILRRFLNAVRCTLAHQLLADRPGAPKDWISIKIDSRAIDELPAPRPLVEIFVYSPRMEGIHLRGGRVARGGIRWSDRREDFRTEILGLMKTQMVKNAVIVPVGSKGGFYVKRPPVGGTREQVQAEGIACYQTLIRGLLDLTDNYAGDGIRPPADVVRHDPDDPYLVVAADKGTATFSDIANALAQEYGFWLDDAFASGGSAGYDHKKMGITARGAWESVKRHFRELGQDIQTTPFTVTGVGDMSGDVFGNGMLLSRHIKLVAAFDHRHIFIDPAPNPATSWDERKRLFDLPRSSWMDYDKSLLSAGGGIYDRAAKSIALSAEARAVLGIEAPTMTPIDLMRAILAAPGRPALFRRHRHLREGVERKPCRRRRPRQRCAAHQWRPGAGARGRRGRQSRLHPARPRRGGAGRPQDQHRRARQLGRRRHLRPRGQHQDRHRRSDHPRRAQARGPQRAAVLHDRRGGGPGAAPQLPAEPGDQRRRGAGGRGARPAGTLHARAGAQRPARSRRRVPARFARHAHARPEPAVPDAARAVHAAVLRQDRSQRRDPRLRPARRSAARRRALALLPDGAQREA